MMSTKRTTKTLLTGVMLLVVFSVTDNTFVDKAWAQSDMTFWVSGRTLIAGMRGAYPHGGKLGETPSLFEGSVLVWDTGRPRVLTWVKDFPTTATYYVWQRQYSGYGSLGVSIDEVSVTGGARQEAVSAARYFWSEVGAQTITQGSHHVDMTIDGQAIVDAVLFTTDPTFVPYTTSPPFTDPEMLPPPDTNPVLRARRTYRDDSALNPLSDGRGFVVARLPALYGEPYDVPLDDFVPTEDQIVSKIELWSAKNQYAGTTFAVRALDKVAPLMVTASALSGPGGRRLGSDKIDLKVVKVIPRTLTLYEDFSTQQLWPEFQLRDDRITLPMPQGQQGGFGGAKCASGLSAHESRQFWLTINVPPGTPAGLYTGTITFKPAGDPSRRLVLPLELDVRPISLDLVKGAYGMFYPHFPLTPDAADTPPKDQRHVTFKRYRAELKDMVSHGLNSTTLYEGFGQLRYVYAAGMRGYPLHMGWPPADAKELVDEATQSMGFADYHFWTCDEPKPVAPGILPGPGTIEWCKEQIQNYPDTYYHKMAGSLNRHDAVAALADLLDYPIFNLYLFSGPDYEYPTRSKSLGHLPSSYWSTATSDYLAFRAFAGLYNTRSGYLGIWPWAYNDFAARELTYDWANSRYIHVVAYPDENDNPISTVRWEAFKDGVDDVRYLQELDWLVGEARTRLGQSPSLPLLQSALDDALIIRAREYESISGTWIHYLGALPADKLDVSRDALANAIMRLNAPYATDMSVTTHKDVPVSGTLAGTDLDGEPLTYVLLSNGARGRVVIMNPRSGAFRYRPNRRAFGTDSFTYKIISDGIESNVGKVTVTIDQVQTPNQGLEREAAKSAAPLSLFRWAHRTKTIQQLLNRKI